MHRIWTAIVLCVSSFFLCTTLAAGAEATSTFKECIRNGGVWEKCFQYVPGTNGNAPSNYDNPLPTLFSSPSILGSKGYRNPTAAEILLRHELPAAARSYGK